MLPLERTESIGERFMQAAIAAFSEAGQNLRVILNETDPNRQVLGLAFPGSRRPPVAISFFHAALGHGRETTYTTLFCILTGLAPDNTISQLTSDTDNHPEQIMTALAATLQI